MRWLIGISATTAFLCGLSAAQLSYTNTTSSRAINTVYRNNLTTPMMVIVSANNSSTSNPPSTDGRLLVDSVNPPLQQVARESVTQSFGFAANNNGITAIVPPGYYYEYTYTGHDSPFAVTYASETSIDVVTTATQATPVRVLTTIYHNIGTDPIFVSVVVQASSAGSVTLLSDSSATPTTVIGDSSNTSGEYMTVKGWVIPGNYYQVTGSNVTISSWVETTVVGLLLIQQDVTASRCEDGANYTRCNYIAAGPLFAAVTSDMGSFSAAGTHFSAIGATPGSLTEIIAITRNSSAGHSQNMIPVPFGFTYGDRNDNSGSTLGHWIEWLVANPRTVFAGEPRRRIVN